MNTLTSKIIVALAITLMFIDVAVAAPINIVATPQETDGPFIHNVLHVNNDGGSSGVITGWLSLDTSASNFYDPMTGDIQFTMNIFTDSSLSTQVSSLTGVGNVPAANLTGTDTNNVAGSIAFSFSDSTPDTTVYYRDYEYVTSTAGYTANSWDGTYLTLWGAGLFGNIFEEQLSNFNYEYLGTDLVFQTAGTDVPEPSTLALLFAGMFGLVLQKKRSVA